MARPIRCRKIRALPEFYRFSPDDGANGEVQLTLDELETVRLLDSSALTQEEAAAQMGVARTTVTALYETARRKIADCLLNGRRLVISGGAWKIESKEMPDFPAKEGNMRIAVTFENGEVFQHFGHTGFFKFYDVADGAVIKSEVVGTNGQGHGALSGFLKNAGVDTLICGGIGGGAQAALKEAGIAFFGGVSGNADDAVQALLAGNLVYNPNVKCSHHGDGHGEAHSCSGNCAHHGEGASQ